MVTVLTSLAGFGGCWAGLAAARVLDTGSEIGVASVPLVVGLAIGGAWSDRARERELNRAEPAGHYGETAVPGTSQIQTGSGIQFGAAVHHGAGDIIQAGGDVVLTPKRWPAAAVIPRQLPPDIRNFTGRERYLAKLDQLGGQLQGGVLTVSGPVVITGIIEADREVAFPTPRERHGRCHECGVGAWQSRQRVCRVRPTLCECPLCRHMIQSLQSRS